MKSSTVDVLVIGAGPAGSVSSALLHKAGYKVRVVEKEIFPRFVIGESLLPRCMEVLEACGFIDVLKARHFQEKSGAKFMRDGQIADYNFADQHTKGWTWTWQVQRADFDKTLIDTVAKSGVQVDFNTTVTAIEFHSDESSTTTVTRADGSTETIDAKFIVDASGYGRVIPRLFKLDEPSTLTPRKAVFAHMEDPNRSDNDEPNRIIIINYAPETWTWVIPFSTGITSVGFVGSHDYFNQITGNNTTKFDQLINNHPYLSKRFGQSKKIFEPKHLEGWSTKTKSFYGKGFVLTGNVTEFLDPIFSSGVMFATVSSHLATKLLIDKMKGRNVDWEKEYVGELQRGINTFKAFVNTWYDGTLEIIFYSKDQDPIMKRQVCSVLAGYVWDTTNPFVADPENSLRKLAKLISLGERHNKSAK
jgi:flavin-dependent dehydrogenase